jgi:endonuclease/exonuclease/phosphatase family metal-dependent hydrolase
MPYYPPLRGKDWTQRAAGRLLDLRGLLAEKVPRRSVDETLLLATWNLRDFDSNKFGHGPRLPESLHYIAEVISAFDLVALQEVNQNLSALRKVMKLLGSGWDFITTDLTEGRSGNNERMTFVFDRRKITFRNIAGEVVLPVGQKIRMRKKFKKLPARHRIILPEGAELDVPQAEVRKIAASKKVKRPSGNKQILQQGRDVYLPPGHKIHLPRGETAVFQRGNAVLLPRGHVVELPSKTRFSLPDGCQVLLSGVLRQEDEIQFARTPFLVSFQSGWFRFNLCTVHIFYGADSGSKLQRRISEIDRIAKFLATRARRSRENYILLGDFNIVSPEHETMNALLNHGFAIPDKLQGSPTNLFGTKHYDQIAFMGRKNEIQFVETETGAGALHVYDRVFRDADFDHYVDAMKGKRNGAGVPFEQLDDAGKRDYYQKEWRTFQISDHLPMWVELKVDFADEYLKQMS